MKCRIVQESGFYYPQFFNVGYWSYFPLNGSPPLAGNIVAFQKMQDAIDYINNKQFDDDGAAVWRDDIV